MNLARAEITEGGPHEIKNPKRRSAPGCLFRRFLSEYLTMVAVGTPMIANENPPDEA